jgi:hypothetical protein
VTEDVFELFRVHAFSVTPSRTAGEEEEPDVPEGGSIQVSSSLRDVLSESNDLLQSQAIAIDLTVEPETRTSPLRDMLLRYAFGATQTPIQAAQDLATRLGAAMDERSAECLLVVAGYRRNEERRVSMWTFPKEEAFQFKKAGRPSIELLQDIFSRRSRLRKGATFAGKDRKPDFIRGGVLDFQATSRSRLAADFWIVRFLDARLAIQSNTATRRLVGALQTAFSSLTNPDERTQIYTGILALRSGPQKRWSVREFADRFLDGDAKVNLLREIPVDMLDQAFDIDKGVVEERLKTRIFELESGVVVSAPLDAVGQDVKLEGSRLRVSGTIKNEKVRGRK